MSLYDDLHIILFVFLVFSKMAEWVQKKTSLFSDQFSVQKIPDDSRWRHPPGQQHHPPDQQRYSTRPPPIVHVPTSNGGLLSSQVGPHGTKSKTAHPNVLSVKGCISCYRI